MARRVRRGTSLVAILVGTFPTKLGPKLGRLPGPSLEGTLPRLGRTSSKLGPSLVPSLPSWTKLGTKPSKLDQAWYQAFQAWYQALVRLGYSRTKLGTNLGPAWSELWFLGRGRPKWVWILVAIYHPTKVSSKLGRPYQAPWYWVEYLGERGTVGRVFSILTSVF